MLVDTTALSLGTEVRGGIFAKLIDANSPIPCTRTGDFTPVDDMQPSVLVKIYQGESELCEHNVKLGEFEFLLQPPRPVAEATIQLSYHLDANDILHVSAVDKKTGAQQTMVVKGTQNLPRDEVERLRREALQSQQDDHANVRRIRRHNQLEEFAREVLQRVKSVADTGADNKFFQKTEEYAVRLIQALAENDDTQIEQRARDLEAAWQKLLAAMPSVAQPAPAQRHSASTAGPQPEDAKLGSEFVQCANCGAQVPDGFAFCGKCGVPLKKTNCSECGAGLVEGFAFCGKCGAKA